ncbi:MAG: primosome assembly protein PriA [Candidatus Nanopelagicales bacterium]|nr:primosome assembly protein PriA [Candidatus Nanopelagicales bacterium]
MDQLELVGHSTNEPAGKSKRARKGSAKGASPVAEQLPIARVAVEVSAMAVDRLFDYLVPAKLSHVAQPGTRVRIRFAGRLVSGFILERVEQPEHTGRLARIERVSGPPVLTGEIVALTRAVADHYAGTLADILRDAVPPRHAASEQGAATASQSGAGHGRTTGSNDAASTVDDRCWQRYVGGSAMLARLHAGEQLRAAVSVVPTDDPADLLAGLVAAVDGASVIVVPDARDLERFGARLEARFPDRVARLSAAMSTAARYRAFLDILSGARDIVVATRNGAFAPMSAARLLVVWDDGDEALIEPRSPGWHAREVLALRSHRSSASWVAMSHSRSVEVARLVDTGWAQSVDGDRTARRTCAQVLTPADDQRIEPDAPGARIPTIAWRAIRQACHQGPVLVQVARSGYQPAVACAQCRTPARCARCTGPLAAMAAGDDPICRWCGTPAQDWSCDECGSKRLRSMAVGSARTAEELRRAFPGVDVLVSGRATEVLSRVGPEPAIIVCTVGAEPIAVGGYRAAVLLDAPALLARTDLRSEEETLRRWFAVLSLVRGRADGGQVVVTAGPQQRAVQALVRADPTGWASRELVEREETQLPPVWRAVTITGSEEDVVAFGTILTDDAEWRRLGPVAVHRAGQRPQSRLLVLAPPSGGSRLARAVRLALTAKPDRGSEHRVQVRLDPVSLF